MPDTLHLERTVVEQRAAERCNVPQYRPGLYARAFPPRLPPGHEAWIKRRHNAGAGCPDALDDLIDAAPRVVRDWMRRNAAVADGVSVGLPLVPWEDVVRAAGKASALLESLDSASDARRCSVAAIAMAGLLRDVASLTFAHIGEIMGTACGTVQYRVRRHRVALVEDDCYAGVVAGVIHKAFDNIR